MLYDILIYYFKNTFNHYSFNGFIAYLTYFERKVIGFIQLRKGPNVVGPFGLFQPIADGIKFLTKGTIFPDKSNKLFLLFHQFLHFP